MATWRQSEDSSDDESENEVANICFIDFEDQDEVNSYSDDDEYMFEYDELLKVIYKLDEKNALFKKKVLELQKELYEIKENFSKVKLQKSLLRKKMKSYSKRMNG